MCILCDQAVPFSCGYSFSPGDQQDDSSMQADDSSENGDTGSDHVEVIKVDLKRNFLAWQVSLIQVHVYIYYRAHIHMSMFCKLHCVVILCI